MKTLPLEKETRSLATLLSEEGGKRVIYLTKKGRLKYALVPLDEGDEEVVLMRQNKKLMAYLDECSERARNGPTKSLEEVRRELGLSKRTKKSK